MKYAIISDIHGNYPALQAVMEDMKGQCISGFIFVGDYCISGPWPDECIDAIRAVPEMKDHYHAHRSYLPVSVQDPDHSACFYLQR